MSGRFITLKQHHVLGTGPALTEEGLCFLSLEALPALRMLVTEHKVVTTGFQSPLRRRSSQLSTWDGVTRDPLLGLDCSQLQTSAGSQRRVAVPTVHMTQDCQAHAEENKMGKDSALALGSRNLRQADPREQATHHTEPI